MKTGFRIAVIGIGLSGASAAMAAERQTSRTTAKAVEPFAQCFASTQQRASLPWWFVPKANGGTFSNAGARGVDTPYFVDIADKGAVREIRLTTADGAVEHAVDSCV